ncbi:hypothetical protein EAF04_003739 [Stromatinia cepivora]|nr:hypothetical protein EAF04_003739 [Stromatinia cepivora]
MIPKPDHGLNVSNTWSDNISDTGMEIWSHILKFFQWQYVRIDREGGVMSHLATGNGIHRSEISSFIPGPASSPTLPNDTLHFIYLDIWTSDHVDFFTRRLLGIPEIAYRSFLHQAGHKDANVRTKKAYIAGDKEWETFLMSTK